MLLVVSGVKASWLEQPGTKRGFELLTVDQFSSLCHYSQEYPNPSRDADVGVAEEKLNRLISVEAQPGHFSGVVDQGEGIARKNIVG